MLDELLHPHVHHDPALLALCLAVGLIGAFVTTGMLQHADTHLGRSRQLWGVMAAIACSGTAWSVHFIAMLAMQVPVPAVYDSHLTLLSALTVMLVVLVGCMTALGRAPAQTPARHYLGGAVVGVGITAMHHLGVAALNGPIRLEHQPVLLTASAVFGSMAASFSFRMALRGQGLAAQVAGTASLVVAIFAIHGLAMAGTTLVPDLTVGTFVTSVMQPADLATHIAEVVLLLMVAGFAVAVAERRASERLAREAELRRESEVRFRLLVEGVQDYAVLLLDPDGRVVSWNPGAERIKGWRAEEILGQPFTCFYPPETVASGWPAEMLRTAAEAGRYEDEGWRMRKDGTRFWASVVVTALHDETGALRGFSKITRDLTARRREEIVTATATRLQAIVDTMAEALVTIDEAGLIQMVNPAVERLFGYPAAELIGRNIAILMPEPHRQGHDAYIARYRATGERRLHATGREFTGRRKDGSLFPLELAVAETRESGQRLFIGVLRDISERKQREAQLREAHRRLAEQAALLQARNAELEEANRAARAAATAKAQFLAQMSHEIRTPMNAVLGFADLLAQGALGEEESRYATTIRNTGRTLLAIINDILEFSKLEAGKVSLEAVPLALRALLDESLRAAELMAAERGLTFRLELDPTVPEHVTGDPVRLRQVLSNLLANAVKFTVRGSVVLRAAAVDDGEKVRVRFEVQDTGIGIAPERLPQLFSMFEQADATIARRFGGTGLGLAICRKLVEAMGGGIGALSTPEVGSTFWFEVPFLPAAAPPAEAGRDAAAATPLRCGRILVADDVAANRLLLQALLRKQRQEVVQATDGAEAIELAGRERFDLILMDVHMPRVDGLAAARAIRAGHGPNAATPIVALTADVLSDNTAIYGDAGIDLHLPKPVDAARLRLVLAAWLADAPHEQAALAAA